MDVKQRLLSEEYEYIGETSIDPELICSICHLPFQDPRHTPCDEIFCSACIIKWIQTQNKSCPICRNPLSIDVLTQINRPLRNMLDRLRVKCVACGQTGLQRASFEDHKNKVCPKIHVLCSSADVQCPWKGQRDQLDQHLSTCMFSSLRHVISPLIMENQQLKEQIAQMNDQINQQIQKQTNQLTLQVKKYQRENQQLNEQIEQLKTQLYSQQVLSANASSNSLRDISSVTNDIRALKGTWDYIDGENCDSFLKEIGVGMAVRMLSKHGQPRLYIDEIRNKWIVREETTLKATEYEFTLGVEFNETSFDGRELKSIINFKENKWIHTMIDKNGKLSSFVRYVDQIGRQMMEMECGSVKARRWFQRVE